MTSFSFRDWKFCPICKRPGQAIFEAGRNPCFACPCGFIAYDSPWTGGIALIENEDRELLLLKRNIEPHKGLWDSPGGFLESGESLEESLARELSEELGINVVSFEYVCSTAGMYGDRGHPTISAAFVITIDSTDFILETSENSEYGWFSYESLPEIALKDVENAILIRKEQVEDRKN